METVKKRMPILVYHSILKAEASRFEKQMGYLAKSGFTAIDFDLLGKMLGGKEAWPRKPVIVTFDDAYSETADNVLPVLGKYGMTAVFFLPTGFMGGMLKGRRVVDGQRVLELREGGVSFGSHTVNHPHLCSLTPGEVRAEMADSKKTLEDLLGCEVSSLAYPYAEYNAGVKEAARAAGYRFACAVRSGKDVLEDPFEIKRVYVSGSDSMLYFKLKTSRSYLLLRRVLGY